MVLTTPDKVVVKSPEVIVKGAPEVIGQSPVNVFEDDRGYRYVETADWWKKACEPLPSFSLVKWPDYATKVVDTVIDGQPVVIQLWKGWCQRFLGRDDFPGGIGAEVAVYQRINGKTPPDNLPSVSDNAANILLRTIARVAPHELWWPYPALATRISFQMVHPNSTRVFFTAPVETTYWRNRWMDPTDYEKYRAAIGHDVPSLSAEYQLQYEINGTRYVW
ncbi:MAG TPA: hypothetical protein VN903_26750 [Polyangia bacterium]|jgi:hypothetical protein|nr:hypothetical protein [Polyangia bacterium]